MEVSTTRSCRRLVSFIPPDKSDRVTPIDLPQYALWGARNVVGEEEEEEEEAVYICLPPLSATFSQNIRNLLMCCAAHRGCLWQNKMKKIRNIGIGRDGEKKKKEEEAGKEMKSSGRAPSAICHRLEHAWPP